MKERERSIPQSAIRNPHSPVRRIGIMGGTFDPIHIGHLSAADEAIRHFSLDQVVFIPTGIPPHKTHEGLLPADDRYMMTVLATASHPKFSVSRIEVEKAETAYTVDTIEIMQRIFREASFYFITGADTIRELFTWKEPEKLAESCTFIVGRRPGYPLEEFLEELPRLRKSGQKIPEVDLLEMPLLDISSTEIRERVKNGESIKYLVPETVEFYIKKQGYYRI